MTSNITDKLYINTATYFVKWIQKEYGKDFNMVMPSSTLRKQLLGGMPPLAAYDNVAKKLKFEKSSYQETVWKRYYPSSNGVVFIKKFS